MSPDTTQVLAPFDEQPTGDLQQEHRNAQPLHAEPEDRKMSDITMGPPGAEWKYTPRTRTYDLTRGGTVQAHVLRTTRGAEDISVAIDPTKSALVVIDMQNYFLHPFCNDFPSGVAAAERAAEVVRACRQSNIKIIWLTWGLTETDLGNVPAAARYSFTDCLTDPPAGADPPPSGGFGDDLGEGKGWCLMIGSWNAQLYSTVAEQCDLTQDVICHKEKVSGLWNDKTSLSEALKTERIKTLLFAGVNTNQCVHGTLLDAYYQGYDCILVEDCCATKTPGGQELPVIDVSRAFSFVVDSSSLCPRGS
ncbi:hypothetical protein Daus18300_008424 [Diaporthe australafricana]|uniref:Isochorismatase-like domain-containing protein n=1 Tax=Diaporthe australafricana TaxID=127596 RepID=A0ABR3WI36_9PEZI